MESSESKLAPELRRWIWEDAPGERTVIIRLAFSQNLEEAVEALGKIGMIMQSSGPSLIVATSDRDSVMQASRLSWIVRIDLPQQLNMKSRLRTT